MKKHLDIKIMGDVQGVGFRYSARTVAESLAITGFVRNEPDGTVYIEAEGEEAALQGFLHWGKEGPGRARITNVATQEGEIKNFKTFSII